MAGNRNNQPRSAKTHLRITTEEPSLEGGNWQIITTALVSRSGRALDGEAIQFYLDGFAYGLSVPTDVDGRAQQIIKAAPGPKRVSVEAQIAGQPWVARTIVPIPIEEKKPRRPLSFEVHSIGSEGKYRIVGMVRGEANIPIKGVKVTFLNAWDGKIAHTLHTNPDGNFMLVKSVPDGEVVELEVWVRGLHAPNNPTLLRLAGGGGEEVRWPEPGPRLELHLSKSFQRGLEKAGRR